MAASCKSAAISTIPDFEYVSYSRCSFIAELPEISTFVKSPIRLDKYSDGDVFTTSFTVLSSNFLAVKVDATPEILPDPFIKIFPSS